MLLARRVTPGVTTPHTSRSPTCPAGRSSPPTAGGATPAGHGRSAALTMDAHHNFRILDAAFIVGAVITFLADQATGRCAGVEPHLNNKRFGSFPLMKFFFFQIERGHLSWGHTVQWEMVLSFREEKRDSHIHFAGSETGTFYISPDKKLGIPICLCRALWGPKQSKFLKTEFTKGNQKF